MEGERRRQREGGRDWMEGGREGGRAKEGGRGPGEEGKSDLSKGGASEKADVSDSNHALFPPALFPPAAPRHCIPAPAFLAARLTPIEGRELRALCMRENDELLVLHRAYEESVQDGIFGELEKEYRGVSQAITWDRVHFAFLHDIL